MKKLLAIAVLAVCVFSCGEAGLGFNIGKEFPLTIPVDLGYFPSIPVADPPEFTVNDSYDLDKVDAFSDDLDNLEEVIVNKISYELSGVETNEQLTIQAMTIELFSSGNSLGTIDITDQLTGTTLSNISKTEVSDINVQALSSVLEEGGSIGTEVTFDFGEYPPNDFDFDFTFHFDVVVKIRDL